MAVNKVRVLTNWEAFGAALGHLDGIREGLDSEAYTERVIERAHGKASSVFDVAAASVGAAGGLAHVFEFGTAGITRGPVRHPNPTSPTARLWVHELSGKGKNKTFGFVFRPAVTRNPNYTTKYTGIPSKYLKKLSRRKYVFWNKATVMEAGTPVTINSRQTHGLLFVPFMGKPPANRFNKRGYMMWNAAGLGPITTVPGRSTKGNFTRFWVGWWSREGRALMNANISSQMTQDIHIAQRRVAAAASRHKLKPAAANDVRGASARSRKESKSAFGKGGRG